MLSTHDFSIGRAPCPLSPPTIDHPVNALEIERPQVFQQGLNRERTHGHLGLSQGFDTHQAVLAVLDARRVLFPFGLCLRPKSTLRI